MFYLISYDISPDRRRTKVAKLLEGFGQRVQYSVFECDLEESQFRQLEQRLLKLIDENDGDNLRIYRMCGACERSIAVYGSGPAPESSPDLYIF
jgi:CRISPR-associated protein Cas2